MKTGTLYIVSTPIGNLEDITLRALRILKEVDLIAAEDTRRTKVLLDKYGIHKKLLSYYSYNRIRKKEELIGLIKQGRNIALVSDSGTPGISDPGFLLIKDAIENGISVSAIPGPVALITALVISGKATGKFIFEGFLSNKTARRKKQLEMLLSERRTIILYESCHRILKLLEDILEVMGDREIAIARELTKKFEEIRRERVSTALAHFKSIKPRGEFILVL